MAVIETVVPSRVIGRLERDLDLAAEDVARALDTTVRTLERWRAGEAYPQRGARERLKELQALAEHLEDTFATRDSTAKWLRADNRYLGGIKPIEALRAGRVDRVEGALEAFDLGIFI